MIQLRNTARLGGTLLQRTRPRDGTRLLCSERNPGRGSAGHQGCHHATYTKRTIVLCKGHLSLQDESTSSRNLMFEAPSPRDLTADLGLSGSAEQRPGT